MFFSMSPAHKALSFTRSRIFAVLISAIALLGWLFALCVGVLIFSQVAYQQWELGLSNQLDVYLLADSPAEDIAALREDLSRFHGVRQVAALPEESIRLALKDVYSDDMAFALPKALVVTLTPAADRQLIVQRVQKYFPEALINDHQQVLYNVQNMLRAGQAVLFFMALSLLAILLILVQQTVRAGIISRRRGLRVMQFIGATDDHLARIVVRQVLLCAVLGCTLAMGLLGITFVLVWLLVPYALAINVWVWVWALGSPFITIAVCAYSARRITLRMAQEIA